jgi:hypothetical protein
MSEFRIYENPGNKAARLERENAQLRAENRQLREALGDAHVMVPQMVSQEPSQVIQAANARQSTFSTPGGGSVTIGRKPGGGRPSAIPGLAQETQTQDGATTVQIFNATEGAPQSAVSRAAPRVAQRMQNGRPAGGGGMAEFDLGAMRPTPVKPSGESVDDAKERFALLELDTQEQSTGTGTGK